MRQVSATNHITVWLEFLKNPYSETVAKYEKTIPELKEAKELYGKIHSDKKVQELWRLREKAIYDEASAISAAERRGKADGVAEGEAIGIEKGATAKAMETAVKMLSRGMSVDEIADITGLSESKIRNIQTKKE
jgi:predicted transposase/invertase (TIGR01784 family)